MHNLNWCGSNTTVSGNEEDVSLCPIAGYDANCLKSAYSSFWSLASTDASAFLI